MAKPDVFRMLGCVALVTLILVIAVKMSKQCMRIPGPVAVKGSVSLSPSPSASPSALQADRGCKDGFQRDEHGFCVEV